MYMKKKKKKRTLRKKTCAGRKLEMSGANVQDGNTSARMQADGDTKTVYAGRCMGALHPFLRLRGSARLCGLPCTLYLNLVFDATHRQCSLAACILKNIYYLPWHILKYREKIKEKW